ncbi:MAG: hypothetical protein GY937_09485 [bacterium]|nr:hypothetical protein [bacterium]
MGTRGHELCDRHGYPTELGALLDQIVDLTKQFLPNSRGIVLSPSISTGDFLWQRDGSEVVFLSDIDGFVFADTDASGRDRFRQALKHLASVGGGSHFKIDLAVCPSAALGQMPQTFQMAETAIAGFVLVGDDLLSGFPRQFDPRASRQAFLMNLWKPLDYYGSPGWTQAAARLLLDIPLLASSEEGTCHPGHRARAEWLLTTRPGRLGTDPAIRAGVEAALEGRRTPPGDETRLRELLVPALRASIAALDDGPPPPRDPDAALVARFTNWLPPRTPRRRLGELRSILRRPTMPWRDIAWWRARKEALGGAALWGLLVFTLDSEERTPGPGIANCLSRFARRPELNPNDTDFLEKARQQYRQGLVELYPSLG